MGRNNVNMNKQQNNQRMYSMQIQNKNMNMNRNNMNMNRNNNNMNNNNQIQTNSTGTQPQNPQNIKLVSSTLEAKQLNVPNKEAYLPDDLFWSVFKMTKEQFYAQRPWKQKQQKRNTGFF